MKPKWLICILAVAASVTTTAAFVILTPSNMTALKLLTAWVGFFAGLIAAAVVALLLLVPDPGTLEADDEADDDSTQL